MARKLTKQQFSEALAELVEKYKIVFLAIEPKTRVVWGKVSRVDAINGRVILDYQHLRSWKINPRLKVNRGDKPVLDCDLLIHFDAMKKTRLWKRYELDNFFLDRKAGYTVESLLDYLKKRDTSIIGGLFNWISNI